MVFHFQRTNLIGKRWFCAGVFLLSFVVGLKAQVNPEVVLNRIEASLLQTERVDGFSGVVSIGRGDKVLFERSFGWTAPEMDRKNSIDRKFMIASVSKGFVAACILMLEEQGKLSTDDVIGKYLPEYPYGAAQTITIHHLLTHTSGIPDYINDRPLWFKLRQWSGWTPSTDDLISTFAFKPLNFMPGTKFRYSNSGYVLLAKIVEEVSKQPFGVFLAENILEPLGMYDTGVDDFNFVGNSAVPYRLSGGRPKEIHNFKQEWIFGMGEMYSTGPDLRKWLHSMSGNAILSEASIDKMTSAYQSNYGFGWHVQEMFGRKLISHGGYLPGWNSYVYYFPEDSLSVIVLSNSEQANPFEMCNHISRIVYFNETGQNGDLAEQHTFTGRYEIVETDADPETTPFESEIVTVKEDAGALNVKTTRGRTIKLTPMTADEWSDPNSDIRVRISENEGSLELLVSRNGQAWHWRKMSGESQLGWK